nr:MAG: major capsid protein [Microvirus sp.]
MRIRETIPTAPIATEKSVRQDEIRALTSCRAGKVIPVAFVPLLREDRVTRGKLRLALKMAETIHPLMNAVNVTAYVHFWPFLAADRFGGSMDAFNRSYQGVGELHNSTAIPFFTMLPYNRTAEIWKTLGIHWKQGDPINFAPVEAYNEIVNFRRKARSEKLPVRTVTTGTLASAFWKNTNMSHVVPDFDQAAMDGEVQLQFVSNQLDVKSKNVAVSQTKVVQSDGTISTGDVKMTLPGMLNTNYNGDGTTSAPFLDDDGYYSWGKAIFAEMRDAGVTLSLANIELAKQTAAFAKLRDKYSGLDDDHVIDLLMEGIRVPDEALKQPILLDRKSTIFGYSERHAMDGASLDMSVTTGETSLELNFRTPPMNTGGIIMVTLEIVPEQLYERQKDHFLSIGNPSNLPNFMRDYLDPEKVSVVQNDFVDVNHATPTGTFGYAPLNHEWKRSLTRVGGKYLRPATDTFIEDRQRFWAVEKLNPTLTTDFYLVGDLPHNVFLDTLSDPFEVLTVGSVEIVGNTVFGKTLDEDNGSYEAIMGQVDQSRIVQA